jgi:hypothetical protein
MQIINNENISNTNVQDIFLRNASLALIDALNREVYIYLVREGQIEKHSIPFFYNFGGDKQLMQDFFIDLPDGCSYPTLAEGNYDVVPRGSVTLNSFQIRSSDITNKFVRGTFTQEERGDNDQKVLKAYSARLFSLPLDLKFDIKIKCDNLNKMLKITEKIFDFYYKNRVLFFQYRGVRIPAQVQFPEAVANDKKYEFVYNENTYITSSFQVSMETYFPSFDDSSTMYKGNHISQFNISKKFAGSDSVLDDKFIDKNKELE